MAQKSPKIFITFYISFCLFPSPRILPIQSHCTLVLICVGNRNLMPDHLLKKSGTILKRQPDSSLESMFIIPPLSLSYLSVLLLFSRFQLPAENMYHLLDTFQISSDSNVTHACIVPPSPLPPPSTPNTPNETEPEASFTSTVSSPTSSVNSSNMSPLLVCLALRQEESSVVVMCEAVGSYDSNKVVMKMTPVSN